MNCDTLRSLVDANALEEDIQNEIELCPSAVIRGDYVLGNALISKFPLGPDFIPDLTWVNPYSGGCNIKYLELKRPTITIFDNRSKDVVFSREFERAYQKCMRLLEWTSENNDALRRHIEPLRRRSGDRIAFLRGRCTLVVGRQAELTSEKRQREFSARNNNPLITVRTWDGFLEQYCRFRTNSIVNDDYIRSVSYAKEEFVAKPRSIVGEASSAG